MRTHGLVLLPFSRSTHLVTLPRYKVVIEMVIKMDRRLVRCTIGVYLSGVMIFHAIYSSSIPIFMHHIIE